MELVGNISEKVKSFSLLCAAMVVGIHVAGYQEHGTLMWWWSRIGHFGVFLIAVPFFFTASGFFLAGHFSEPGWYRRECVKRIWSLLVPYLFWCLVAVLLAVASTTAANMIHGRGLFANMPTSWHWWSRAFGAYPFAYPEVVPLWYLRTLMLFVILSPLLYVAIKWGGAKILIVICLWAGAVEAFAHGRLYLFMRYTFVLNGLLYFCIGMIMRSRGITLETRHWTISVASLLLGVVVLAFSICGCDETSRCFRLARMLFVPMFLFALWNLLPTLRLPRVLCSVGFPVYLMHVFVWRVLSMIGAAVDLPNFGFLRPDGLLEWGIKWFVGFWGSVLLALALRRVFPNLAYVAFGGRR